MANGRSFDYSASLTDNVSPGFQKMREAADAARTSLGNIAPTATSMASALAEVTKNLNPNVDLVQQLTQRLQQLQSAGGVPPELQGALQNLIKSGLDSTTAVTALTTALQRATPEEVTAAAAAEKLAQQYAAIERAAQQEAQGVQQANKAHGDASASGGALGNVLQQMGVGFIYTHANLGPFTIGLGGLVQQLADVNPLLAAGTIGVTALGSALAGAVQQGAQFQTMMNQIQANTGASDQAIQQMSAGIMTAFTSLNSSLADLGSGEQHITNMSFDAADSLKILQAAGESAANTGANVSDVANLTAMTLYHYGEGASSASQFLDILTVAAQRGNTTFKDFSENSQRATSVAAQLHVPLTDAAAALSVLTKAYGSSAQAQTQFVNILTHLDHPSRAAADALDALSKKTGDLALASANIANTLSSGGLTGVLDHLNSAYQKLGYTQAQATQNAMSLVNAQRGGLGLSFLLTTGQQAYNSTLSAFSDITSGKATPTADQFAKTQDTLQFQLQKLGNEFQAAGINLGTQLLPQITAAVEGFGKFLDAAVKVGVFIGQVLGPVFQVLGVILNGVGTLFNTIGTLFNQSADAANKAGPAFIDYGKNVGDGTADAMQQAQTNLDALDQIMQASADNAGTDGTNAGSNYTANMGDATTSGLSSDVQPAIDAVSTALDTTDPSGKTGWSVGTNYTTGGKGDGVGVAPAITAGTPAVSDAADKMVKSADKTEAAGKVGTSMGAAVVDNFNTTVSTGINKTVDQLNAWAAVQSAHSHLGPIFDSAVPHFNLGGGVVQRPDGSVGPPLAADPTRDSRPADMGGAPLMWQPNGSGNPYNGGDSRPPVASKYAGFDKDQNYTTDPSQVWTKFDGTEGPAQIAAKKAAEEANKKPKKGPSAASQANKAFNASQSQSNDAQALQDIADKEKQAKADNAVAQAEANAASDADLVKTALANLDKQMSDSKAEEQSLLDPLQSQLKKAQGTLKDMQSEHKIVTDSMKEQIYQYQQQLYKTQQDAKAALAPLQAAADAAAAALQKLQSDLAEADRKFQVSMRIWQDDLYALGQAEKNALAPLQKQLQQYQDQLYNLQQAASAALTPIDDALYNQNLALQAARDHAQAVADTYDQRLLPLQKQYQALQNEDTRNQQQQDLANMGLTVTNITERLQNAKKGTAEYNALLQQQEQAQGSLNQKRKEYSLADEIQAIQDAKTAAVDAANTQVAAQQKIVDALQKQRDAVARTYELQERAVQAQIDATQRQMDLTQRQYDEQKAMVQDQLDAITRAQELYDRQQSDKIHDAEVTKANADADLKTAQDAWTAKEQLIQDEEDKVNERLTVYQHDADQQEAAVQGTIDDLNNNIGTIQDKYEAIQKGIQGQIDSVTGYGKDLAAADNDVTTSAKNYAQSLKDTKSAQDDFYNTQQAIAKYAHDYGVDLGTAEKVFEAMGGTPGGGGTDGSIGTAATALNNLGGTSTGALPTTANAVSNLTDKLNTGLAPAISGLSTSAVPLLQGVANAFLKFFGGPSDPNFDASVSIEWLLDTHNDNGFWGRIFYQWRTAFGETGLQKILHDSLVTLGTNVKPYLDTFASVFTDAGTQAAQNFADAFVAGINSKMANITLHVSADGGGTPPPGSQSPVVPPVTGGIAGLSAGAGSGGYGGLSAGYLPSYVGAYAGVGVPVQYNDYSTYNIEVNFSQGEGLPAVGDWKAWRSRAKDLSRAARTVVGKGTK